MILESAKLALEFAEGKLKKISNKVTGQAVTFVDGEEFVLSIGAGKQKQIIPSSQFEYKSFKKSESAFMYQYSGEFDINVKVVYKEFKDGNFKKSIVINSASNVFIDYVDYARLRVPSEVFKYSVPAITEKVHIPAYITTLGQPVYINDLFFGLEFPTADNRIADGFTHFRLYYGRNLSEISEDIATNEFVVGAAIGGTLEKLRSSFFAYLQGVIRPQRFRVQYNSWYDNMLDINSENIKKSFLEVHEGFKKAGMRDLDCYVVDDGWVDYNKREFWGFDDKKFPEQFKKESQLTKELNSTFGVWFGPRGGYNPKTFSFAKKLRKLGYGVCCQSMDICTGDPKYIHDLCAKMADFVKNFNVTYFKIDGFAKKACKSKKHSHPVGGTHDMYFYTFLWKEWVKGFDLIRQADPDVFLNVTSFSHCSPWFLKWCDALWINNAADMAYEGKGSNLNQCLNYRDGRYYDFSKIRQLQFPVAYIYNHEPCYAERNYNPPLPAKSHKTVYYTDEEFEAYLTACMMRGTGFIEAYFSPHMMDGKKWKIAADVFKWAEENFDIIKNNAFFGGVPKNGEVYGYYGFEGNRALMMVRNPDDKVKTYQHNNEEHCFKNCAYDIKEIYPKKGNVKSVAEGEIYDIELKPYSFRLFEITLK